MGSLVELIADRDIADVQRDALRRLEQRVREQQMHEASGHDWWHTYRVVRMALRLSTDEGGDRVVIFLAALLHDIADHKFHEGDEQIGPRTAGVLMTEFEMAPSIREHVTSIIASLSFKGVGTPTPMASIEGAIVQDADRLDAIGALGVARVFAYGGKAGRVLHDPEIPPVMHSTAEAYKHARGTSINHFYEKLLLLNERINTESARHIAAHRTAVIEAFLAEFLLEWDGNDAPVPTV